MVQFVSSNGSETVFTSIFSEIEELLTHVPLILKLAKVEGRSLSLRNRGFSIPWHEYVEEEVQAILYEYFASKGYDINWYHRAR
jgi:hypothetical protein